MLNNSDILETFKRSALSGGRKFRKIVLEEMKRTHPECREKDFYFQQTALTYEMAYKPSYPDASPEDFVISVNHMADEITVSGSFNHSLPGTRKYSSWKCFLEQNKQMQEGANI